MAHRTESDKLSVLSTAEDVRIVKWIVYRAKALAESVADPRVSSQGQSVLAPARHTNAKHCVCNLRKSCFQFDNDLELTESARVGISLSSSPQERSGHHFKAALKKS
jgi:hypothetical protein